MTPVAREKQPAVPFGVGESRLVPCARVGKRSPTPPSDTAALAGAAAVAAGRGGVVQRVMVEPSIGKRVAERKVTLAGGGAAAASPGSSASIIT